jgi:hypothetical protein
VEAFMQAHDTNPVGAGVVASLPEGMPEGVARQLLERGIAPMQGLSECLDAIGHAQRIGVARRRVGETPALSPVQQPAGGPARMLDEAASKKALAAFGLPIPDGALVDAAGAPACAQQLGFPVVVKAVSATLAHKTEAGAVRLNLRSGEEVGAAVAAMAEMSDRFLVERMAHDVVAEILVGVHRDAQFGLALTLGAGGLLVELLHDSATLLLPVSRADVLAALQRLRTWPLVTGFRARAAGDVQALLDAVLAVADFAQANAAALLELDVNPVLVLPQGRGVVAVDALIRVDSRLGAELAAAPPRSVRHVPGEAP